MWINRHRLNNSLVVFIHGLFGNQTHTWGILEYFQDEVVRDPLIRSYDMYLFQYDSSFRRQPAIDPVLISQFGNFLENVSSKYSTVVLVAHSQGGLLAKTYVTKKLLDKEGLSLNVDVVITLGTPHKGNTYLNPLAWLRKIPLAGGWIPFEQLAQLASRSPLIRALRDNWTPDHISPKPCRPSKTRRHIRSVCLIGEYDRWVSRESAGGFPVVDERMFIPADHPSLATLESRERTGQAILKIMRDHADPSPIIAQIQVLIANSGRRLNYQQRFAKQVSQIVRLRRRGLTDDGVRVKTASLLTDFLYEYPERPLRSLDFDGALTTYVERVLGREV